METAEVRNHLIYLGQLDEQLEESRKNDTKVLYRILPTQQKVLDAYNDPKINTVLLTSPNQYGKTHIFLANMIASALGHQPWDGKPRKLDLPIRIAVLIPDYDSHGRNLLSKFKELYPLEKVRIEKTQQGAPRCITFKETGSVAHIFTHDQDQIRLEGGTYHELYIDEPCPRGHYVALRRGLSRYGGKTFMTMTPLTEPWIFEELYNQAGNMGGPKKWLAVFTAFPDENKKSEGGFLEDEDVEIFRDNLLDEEREARVYGRWIHLIGRVYKSFDTNVHVVDDARLDPNQGTTGLVVDPHDRLPFALTWFYVTPSGDKYIYDEWPNERYNKIRYCDLSIEDYVDIIKAKGPAFFRIMDPNYGVRKSVTSGVSIAESFQMKGLYFHTTVNDDVAAGHKAVQDHLRFNKEKPLSPINQPKLYFAKSCHNHISAFNNYVWDDWRGRVSDGKAPKQKPREEYKHFCDNVRYLCMYNPRYVPKEQQPQESFDYGARHSRGWENLGKRGLGYTSATQKILQQVMEARGVSRKFR